MRTTLETESPTKRKLTIEVEADELAPLYEETIKRLGKEVKIPGFRKGKIPKAVLESRLGAEAIKEEFLRDALPALYSRAAQDEDLDPITYPDIDVTSYDSGGSLEFTATLEVRPQINLPEDLSLSAERPSFQATDEEIDDQLKKLQERFGTLEAVGRNAQSGDYVTMDLFAYKHDEKIDQASAEDLLYEVGSGSFLPELDAELADKRVGDILQFNAKFPERFGPPHGGEEVSFKVIVKEVQVKTLPALDDEFATTASEFDTLEDLKAEVRRRIDAVKEVEADLVVRNSLVDQLLDIVDVTPPQALVAAETESRLARLLRELERSGLTLEAYLEANQATKEQLVANHKMVSEKIVAADLILEEIASREGIEVENEDFDKELDSLSRQTGREPKDILQELVDNGRVNALAGDILRRKALDLIVQKASITDQTTETA